MSIAVLFCICVAVIIFAFTLFFSNFVFVAMFVPVFVCVYYDVALLLLLFARYTNFFWLEDTVYSVGAVSLPFLSSFLWAKP